MAIPFSQTLESRRPDFFRLFMSGILLTAPLVLLWAWWLFSVPIPVYKTSLQAHVTGNSRTKIKFSDKKGEAIRAQKFITRQITARFSEKSIQYLKRNQQGYFFPEQTTGRRGGGIPVTVVKVLDKSSSKAGQVILRAEHPLDRSATFADGTNGTVRIAVDYLAPVRILTRPPSDTLPDAPLVLFVAVVNRYPHDRKAFTQGLAWDRGTVYEGTGLYGRSSLRRVDLESGRVKQQREYNRQIFAEGVTVFQDTVFQLTWKNNLVFQYSKNDLSQINSWKYPRQGWGLTHDGRSLIASDGTADLFFLDPKTLNLQRRITVHDDQGEVTRLNELEYIKGLIYANVWETERIAVISPETGTVTAWLDLSPLCKQIRAEDKQADVLNGIMYDPAADRLFVTGKLWPALFEIRVVSADKQI